MNKLNLLIKKLCPNGVEYKTIKETVGLNRGSRLVKNQLSDKFEYEVYHGSKDTVLGKYNNFNAPANTTIVVNTGGIGGVKFIDKPFWCSDGSFWLGHCNSINDKFLYYCLAGYEEYFASKKRVGGVPTIDRDVVESFKIPVPPLEVQCEIVHILDQFTLLTAELTSELTARKEQYKYYRDELFNFDSSIKKVKLQDVADIIDSLHQTPKYVAEGYSMIRVMDIKGTYICTDETLKVDEDTYKVFIKRYKPKFNDIIVSRVGSFGNFSLVPNEDICLGQNIALIKPNINYKYLYYYLNTPIVFEYLNSCAKGGSYKNIGIKDIVKIPVYIPSEQEQQRIVDILDKFDTYCNDLTQGLPAEIELRKQQYEYYRDKLLSFKELKN